jgi:hypothetical protein
MMTFAVYAVNLALTKWRSGLAEEYIGRERKNRKLNLCMRNVNVLKLNAHMLH